MCKLTNIMNKLHDNQPMMIYHGTDCLYHGIASMLYKSIDAKFFDMEIQTIKTDATGNLIIVFDYIAI